MKLLDQVRQVLRVRSASPAVRSSIPAALRSSKPLLQLFDCDYSQNDLMDIVAPDVAPELLV